MLMIMYGLLPLNQSLMDIKGKNIHEKLDILNVKFIAANSDGIIFAALVTDTQHYQSLSFSLESIYYKTPSKRSSPCHAHFCEASEHTKKRHYRKSKNLTLTRKNWKQFIGNKHTITQQVLH
ncbi:hypothetical protein [Vibrio algicola]|uniref:hypothetical protein n=1 Tax=Vibrio algicola TaxID=2662262 RepID=UPI0015B543C9|nr:hypothetical protein [Vibrio algicola]